MDTQICRVCGDSDVSYYWSSYWLSYCSFDCHSYAMRWYNLIIAFVFGFLALLPIGPAYAIIISLGALILSIYGFTRDIDKSDPIQTHPNHLEMTHEEIQADNFKNLVCFSCKAQLTLDDQYCPKCGKSTHQAIMKYYQS